LSEIDNLSIITLPHQPRPAIDNLIVKTKLD